MLCSSSNLFSSGHDAVTSQGDAVTSQGDAVTSLQGDASQADVSQGDALTSLQGDASQGKTVTSDSCSIIPRMCQPRCCHGHEVNNINNVTVELSSYVREYISLSQVAVPIDTMVTTLDVKEECIATLLCYLELEDWLEVMNPVHDVCKLTCYNGARQLKVLATKVPAIAAATATLRKKGTYLSLRAYNLT